MFDSRHRVYVVALLVRSNLQSPVPSYLPSDDVLRGRHTTDRSNQNVAYTAGSRGKEMWQSYHEGL